MRVRCGDERGTATGMVGAAGLLFLACFAAVVIVVIGQVNAHKAQGAADLAALAAASAYKFGTALPCAAASESAESNRVTLLACEVSAGAVEFVATVEVEAKTVGSLHKARVKAHAGVVQT